MRTWKHDRLGTFELDEIGWQGTIQLPAFQVFTFSRRSTDGTPDGYSLTFDYQDEFFDSEDDYPTPSDMAIGVCERLLDNQAALVGVVKSTLFDDFRGKGRDSGMWWHGDLDAIARSHQFVPGHREKGSLTGPDDLDVLLGDFSVNVLEEAHGYEKPCAVLCFEAPFEPEHGVGVLTDGDVVLGLGYQHEPSSFSAYDNGGAGT